MPCVTLWGVLRHAVIVYRPALVCRNERAVSVQHSAALAIEISDVDSLSIAENDIHGNDVGWACNGALVGNHVMTSDTTDPRNDNYNNYGSGNVTFFTEPAQQH